ncbi:telomere repeats-binding bouquet formation protein 2 [Myripristis murdjan]|uniref:telomere repeats-binding bouquet formation protein 2 n=1 Tax=Myripristis murdjan TaxID=586833 RepID=UPI001176217B|nr:telomere repeats-binding bouquet formation protein 2 [Myripristis murdjan]
MFHNRTAWFSDSVTQARRNFWMTEGGAIASWRKAEYLFSDNAACPDTVRIFESRDYLWNQVTVFHSLFLSACEKRQSVKSVSIGHYVLPPARVQDEVRDVVGRFIWEPEDDQSTTQSSCRSFGSETDDEMSSSDTEESDSEASQNEAILSFEAEDYPANNMLTGYVSMDNLQKYSGDLGDFYPGCFRCCVCKARCYRVSVGLHR